MIFTLNCFISKSLPNHLAGKTEPPGIFEWLLGVAARQKFARLQRLVLKNLAYAVSSLCNALGARSQADSCTRTRRDTELLKLGMMLLHQRFWSPAGNVANGTGVPSNLHAFCLQSAPSEVFVCWEAEVVWSNYTSACAEGYRGTRVPGRKCSACKLYVLFTNRTFIVPSLCSPGPLVTRKMSSVFWLWN